MRSLRRVYSTRLPPAGSLCPGCSGVNFAKYFLQEIDVRWDRTSTPHVVGPGPNAVCIGTLAEIYSRSHTCTFCNLVLAALCRNQQSLNKWTDPRTYVERMLKNGRLDSCAAYIYSYLYAEDPSTSAVAASYSRRHGLNDSTRQGFQIGIGLRKVTTEDPNRPYLDHAAVINIATSSAETTGASIQFCGRITSRVRANMNLVKNWLEECINMHGALCEKPGLSYDYETITPQDLRVIDVQYMCLVILPPASKYLALSYCWGSSNRHFTLSKSNLTELEERNSLQNVFSSLSGTIQDSIHCVRELGERFLWIDALCIIQDDDWDKEKHISQMDRVYECSIATIVSASPHPELSPEYDCHPGYRSGTRLFTQQSARLRGLELCTSFASVEKITDPRNTVWSTRAWTFQEEVLSRRRLYFTAAQIFFQCSCGVFCEDAVGEEVSPSACTYEGCSLWNACSLYANPEKAYGNAREGLSRSTFKNQDESFDAYMDIIERYTCRDMSNQGDALIALEGVLAILTKTMKTYFIWGLPESLFDEGLLWMQIGGLGQRRDAVPNGYSGKAFPTWSWAAWKGRSNYRAQFFPIYTHPEIDWFLIAENSTAAKLSRKGRCSLINGFNASDHQVVRPESSPPAEFLKELRLRNQIDTRHIKSASMACWTSIASFLISSAQVDKGKGAENWPQHQNLIICDSESRHIGAIRMEKAWVARLEKENRYEFMLLSRANIVENITALDEDAFPIHDWVFLNVMLIQRTGDGAQRLGIGWIHENAWVHANPAPTLLRLE